MHHRQEINGVRFKTDDSKQEAKGKKGCDPVNIVLYMDGSPEEGGDSDLSHGTQSRVSEPLEDEPSKKNLFKNRRHNDDPKKKGRKKGSGFISVDHKRRNDRTMEEESNYIG